MILRALVALNGAVEKIAFYMGRAAGWAYLLCALFITFDVFSRRFLGFSSKATVEIGGYLLALGTSWAMADALAGRNHIRVDVLVTRMPLLVRSYLHALALLFLFAFTIMLTDRSWAVFTESWALGSRDTSALFIPLVIPQGLWAIGFTVFAALAGVVLARALVLLALGRRDDVERLLSTHTLAELGEIGEAIDMVEAVPGGEAL